MVLRGRLEEAEVGLILASITSLWTPSFFRVLVPFYSFIFPFSFSFLLSFLTLTETSFPTGCSRYWMVRDASDIFSPFIKRRCTLVRSFLRRRSASIFVRSLRRVLLYKGSAVELVLVYIKGYFSKYAPLVSRFFHWICLGLCNEDYNLFKIFSSLFHSFLSFFSFNEEQLEGPNFWL